METLRLEKLSKQFGQLQILNDVSLTVGPGERKTVLLGPNGAGKTTLFNLITGEIPPTTGRIYLFSQDITRMPCHRRVRLGLGRTYQTTNLFLNLTVMDNLLIALNPYKASPFHMLRSMRACADLYVKAKELLCRVGDFWGKQDFPLSQLSYGEVRQMELILGLAIQPRILLLDEPTAGLTASEAEALAAMIRNLPEDLTIVMIEHDMKVAFAIADHILVLHQGKVLASGTPEEIRANQEVREVYLGRVLPHA
ncbi:MAG: ABC transporter ATP-binding protein [Deltaproteobacteria bacterium]